MFAVLHETIFFVSSYFEDHKSVEELSNIIFSVSLLKSFLGSPELLNDQLFYDGWFP